MNEQSPVCEVEILIKERLQPLGIGGGGAGGGLDLEGLTEQNDTHHDLDQNVMRGEGE
ncbi:MAG TPA: hypothetical protein VF343_02060 [Syntrophales bacterium]